MKITSIRIDRLGIPLKKPYHLSRAYGILAETTPVVVRAETDAGIAGCGECDPWPLFTGDSSDTVMTALAKCLCPALLGADPLNPAAVRRTLDGVLSGNLIAKSALDMAVYDILGKASGLPVSSLLGGRLRDAVSVMWPVGGGTPGETAADVLAAKDAGYDGVMIKIGTDWKNDALRVIAAREAAGDGFPINVDANQGWDVRTAIRFGRAVADCGLEFFEQPVPANDPEGLAQVRRSVSMPVSADEGVVTVQDARRLAALGACDIFSIKVTKHGGIRSAKAICDYAAAHGIGIFMNSMIEEGITQAASLAVGAAAEGLVPMGHAYFSPLRLDADISTYSPLLRGGTVKVPTVPGLGAELIPEQVARYSKEQAIIK